MTIAAKAEITLFSFITHFPMYSVCRNRRFLPAYFDARFLHEVARERDYLR
jgi:hypothetical protein